MEHKDGSGSRRSRDKTFSSSREDAGESASVTGERAKYEAKILESQRRLTKYTAENDRLLDEVSNLRLQMREMKNDRAELVRAHQESMGLLAQVSEEKLVEFKSKSEQEAVESRAAQEEALRTVLEMMEKDCEDRVAELDAELARVEEDRERATQLQLEAAAKAAAEEQNKGEVEEAAKLAIEKLVQERASRDVEVQNLEEREKQLQFELEMTKHRAQVDKRAAIEASERGSPIGMAGSTDGSRSSYSSNQGSEDGSDRSPLIGAPDGSGGRGSPNEESSRRPPVVGRHSIQKHTESPFLLDPLYEMTWGRRIALKLQGLPWYQPQGSKQWDVRGLGLQSAWAYFEHSVLPRYIVKKADGSTPNASKLPGDQSTGRVHVYESESDRGTDAGDAPKSDGGSDVDDWLYTPKEKQQKRRPKGERRGFVPLGKLDRAEPGETQLPTRLYSPLFTPLTQLGDFGIGVGLYFTTLRAVAVIALIAGCINLPNIFYFASEEYSKGQPGVITLLKGSAICTDQVWVPCPTCTVDQFHEARGRIAGATTVTPSGELQTLVFALKNACDGARFQVGIVNMASLGFILVSMVLLTLYQRRKQLHFDEQHQTAQDYSIEISNPPGDATEPEEWKEFFESRFGGHLTCCTVAIDNDLLVKALAERREVLFDIQERLKDGATINTLTLSEMTAKIERGRHFLGRFKSKVSPGIPELAGRLMVLNGRIQGLAQQDSYKATRVFCTFETESAQRQVLSQMTVGSMASAKNTTHNINPTLLFRGEHVLHVREAEEPNTVRWQELDQSRATRAKKIAITTLLSLLFTVVVAYIVYRCRQKGNLLAVAAISNGNALFPPIAKALTNFESHASETTRQSSLYVKIAVFRWVVTAIVITIITPFTSTISYGPQHLLFGIFTIFIGDLIVSNGLQLLDIPGNFKRHFLAPRARSQERMNLLMGGTEYTVAERYTNMTKTLFLTFYYCAIYPSAFFLCAMTLIINYFVDKFSLMRTWKPAPHLGPHIAKFSRMYFMTTAIAALAIVSSYLFSGFPFDNLCAEDVSHSAYYGTWKITNGEGQESTTVIEPTVRSYHHCNQFLGPGSNFAFPALPDAQPEGSTWMTDEQEQLTGIYGWISVVVLGLVGMVILYRVLQAVQGLFSASYKPHGEIQGASFSQLESISSYIPQVPSGHFTHPLVAVNIDYVDESLFDWTDTDRSHAYYDLTRDAEQLMKGKEDVCDRAFSQIRHWPPGGGGVEGGDRSTKSALRRAKEANGRPRGSVSWSSKVTCKTYSKDDPNAFNSFNANASTSEGMNFAGHQDPLFDPHAQNEARVYQDNNGFDPYAPQDGAPPRQMSPNQGPPQDPHFDPYQGTGLDYANQQPDAMYGDSQNQDAAYAEQNQDGAGWGDEGSAGTGSYEQSSGSGSVTTGTGSTYTEGTGSYTQSDGGSRSGSDSNTSASNSYAIDDENQQEFGVYEDEQDEDGDGQEAGSYSTGSSASGLPPVT
ncbi:hypothetical protein ACHAXT_010209 [Thalassiosira profunda]